MRVTDISEKGLELLIVGEMTGTDGVTPQAETLSENAVGPSSTYAANKKGWLLGRAKDYDRGHALDLVQLCAFLHATQPTLFEKVPLHGELDPKDSQTAKFLARLSSEIGKVGVVDVLRKGIEHGPHHVWLFYGTPSEGNTTAEILHTQNRFSVTRQLRYSHDETRNALDLVLFVNGLPIATLELKNSLTKQTVADAVEQYKTDRDKREKLFGLGRCVVHFAVDDAEVRMCTELQGKASWFLPFNKGWEDGAGNPPNPAGLKTDYLWKDIFAPKSLIHLLEHFAQMVEIKDPETNKKKKYQLFPRYHQLDVVRCCLADVQRRGVGGRYLIQHSAGSGKSNSIAWLAHQLVGLQQEGQSVFDSVVVLTDRRVLDNQLAQTIRQLMQIRATVGHAQEAGDLKRFLQEGKKIIISTIQKFPFILEELSGEDKGRKFALIIDEAHSSQGGKSSTAVNTALSEGLSVEEEEDGEDLINRALEQRSASRKMLSNASYFAFTATPKNKTLEMFGEGLPADAEGRVRYRPFHHYSMKQAIQEGFILDVLKSFTPIQSYYRLTKTIEGDPEFDVRRAQKKLRRYVESHEYAIRLKAEIMVDHFHERVSGLKKIGGKARAMVVCNGIARAIEYFRAFQAYLTERKSSYKAIVAFSGEFLHQGINETEASLNGFASDAIASKIKEDPYRFLICADKFQTGYDEPLLHTMYVDKPLSGIKAVQTLSRLNRAHPEKYDVFVLDFYNDATAIADAFSTYYRTTVLSEGTDPNRLNDLKRDLDRLGVYAAEEVERLVGLFLSGASREKIDPLLDIWVSEYQGLDEEEQIEFKGKAKAFVRVYSFLASVSSYPHAGWEGLSIVLNLLIPKLPAPKEEDRAKGILETVDMESYRAEKQAVQSLRLVDADAEIAPVPVENGGGRGEAEMDRLSRILDAFNAHFGALFTDADRVIRRIREDIAPKVAADTAYQNAKNNTPATARIEHDKVLDRVMLSLLKDDTEVYKQFQNNDQFKREVRDLVYRLTSGGLAEGKKDVV
ncbi:DEAD/DEAH box helicase family protein [Myxococcota bacterium]|nr:DEAD/DEAH box helicase family protein [Myxococcota bacterium]